jgi:hypothetical protein
MIPTGRILAPPRAGPPDRGYGLFAYVLGDPFQLDVLLAAAGHMVDLIFDVIFVLAFATIELVRLAVLEGLDEIVAIPTVDDVRAVGFSVEPVVLAVAPVVRESDAPITERSAPFYHIPVGAEYNVIARAVDQLISAIFPRDDVLARAAIW